MNTSIRSTDLNIDLSRFDRTVQPETKPRPKFESIPDGKFDVRIEDVELYVSPKTNNPVLKYTLRVLGPTHANQLMWKYRGITENTLSYILDELKVCGLELERFSDLKHHLHDLIGVELEVTRRSRGEDVSIFFNDQLAGKQNADLDDDDLPF